MRRFAMTEAVLAAGTVLWCLLPQLEDRFLWAKTGFDTYLIF
jgi:hypothetical protein